MFNRILSGGSRAAATSKMERFVTVVNGFQPLTIMTKRFIFDVAAVLDPPLKTVAAEVFLDSVKHLSWSIFAKRFNSL